MKRAFAFASKGRRSGEGAPAMVAKLSLIRTIARW